VSAPQLSIQLYSVAAAFEADREATLTRLSAMGLRNVEAVNITKDTVGLRALAERLGLSIRTAHGHFLSDVVRFGDFVIEVPPVEATLEAAATLGVEILIDPSIAHARWTTKDEVTKTAELLNEFAAKAARQGLRVGYHNHSYEFRTRFSGESAFEYFAGLLEPSVVLELDVFWAATAGEDVPALLARLGDRVRALHVKDGIIGPDPMLTDTMPDLTVLDQRAAGGGELPFAEILASAPAAEFAVIEFDHYPGDIFEGIETGVQYFNAMNVR
jgi:sugar phosphate isomerase/epimerase